jgi:hypothetical protein
VPEVLDSLDTDREPELLPDTGPVLVVNDRRVVRIPLDLDDRNDLLVETDVPPRDITLLLLEIPRCPELDPLRLTLLLLPAYVALARNAIERTNAIALPEPDTVVSFLRHISIISCNTRFLPVSLKERHFGDRIG